MKKQVKSIDNTKELTLTCRLCGYKLIYGITNDTVKGVIREYFCGNSLCESENKTILKERYNPIKDRYEAMY